MSPETENERVVRAAFAAINSGDHAAIREWATEDCEAYTRMSSVTGRPYAGHEGIAEWVREVHDQFSEFKIELSEVAELSPGRVLAAAHAEVRGKESDLPWREDVFYALAFAGEKVRTLRMFLDRSEAEEAVRAGE